MIKVYVSVYRGRGSAATATTVGADEGRYPFCYVCLLREAKKRVCVIMIFFFIPRPCFGFPSALGVAGAHHAAVARGGEGRGKGFVMLVARTRRPTKKFQF